MKTKSKDKHIKTDTYAADDLKVLRFPESIRKRPSMYVGGVTADTGLFRIFKETVDNSVDEVMNGHGTTVYVEYHTKTKVFVVADRGRGIPTGMNKAEKKSGLELAMTNMHGSGKFDQANYVSSSGMNGIGCKALAALSTYCKVWSANEKVWKGIHLKRGIIQGSVTKDTPKHAWAKKVQGTIVEWVPDPKIFGTEEIDVARMLRELHFFAMLNPGVTFDVVVDGKKTIFKSEHGLLDMIYGTAEQKQITLGKPFHFQKSGVIDIAVSWQDTDMPTTQAFVNSSYTPEEGTHVQGARNAIVEALRVEMESSKKTPAKTTKGKRGKQDKEAAIDGKFLLMGMQLAMNWRMSDPMYSGQTKDKLTSSEVVTQAKNIVLPEFSKFLKQNPKLISMLLDRAKKFQKAADKFQQDLSAVKSIKLVDPTARGVLPGKLTQAHGYKPDQKELILVEGDSAEGSCKKARMPWQEVLPLRGKILNPMRTDTAKFMASQEVINIFTAIGALPGDSYESKKRRVGTISLLPDADPDGRHIGSELVALFTRYLPDYIDKGKVQIIDAPLFVGACKGTKRYSDTRDGLLDQFQERERKGVIVTRVKGWGECLLGRSIVNTTHGFVRLSSLFRNKPMGWSELDKPIHVLDRDGIERRVTKVFKKKAAVLRLRIGGRTIKATRNHPFLVCENGVLAWKSAGDLVLGDIVISNRSIVRFGDSPKFSTAWIKHVTEHAVVRTVPEHMTPELARLLGYLVADGSGSYEVSTGEYLKVAQDVKYCFEASFPGNQATIAREDERNMWTVRLSHAQYYAEFMHSIGYRKGKDSYTKDVPESIFTSTRECVAAFIQGVMESDGYFGAVRNGSGSKMDMIEHYTASSRLANSMTALFAMFGIHAPYKEERNVYDPFKKECSERSGYQLQLFGSAIDTYLDEIGVVSDDKCHRLLEYRKSKRAQLRVRNTNTDVLYGVKSALRIAQAESRIGGTGSRSYEINGSAVQLNIGFSTAAADITYSELARHKDNIRDIEKLSPDIASTLRYCLKNNPRFVKVEEIKKQKSRVVVGDIEVPVSHSYIAEGLIVHNCQAEDLRVIAMDPATRKVTKFKALEHDKTVVQRVMGEDVNFRKEMLGIKEVSSETAALVRKNAKAERRHAHHIKRAADKAESVKNTVKKHKKATKGKL